MELMLLIHLILKTVQTDDDGEIDNVEILVPLKHVINFWRTLEILLISYKFNLIFA